MSYNSKYKGSEVEELLDSIGNKVDKVDGKQLSTEDFTTLLKQKLDGLSNYDDTAIQASVSKLRTDLDTLVSGDTTTAIKTFNEVIAFLDGLEDTEDLAGIIASIEQQIAEKQDVISDLATIREGAAKGATAIQEHQDLSGKQDKLVSGTNIKTINGQDVLGEGDIVIEGGNSEANVGAVETDDFVVERKVKDAKDLETGEKIYFKGHAKATYMSGGNTVEDEFGLHQKKILKFENKEASDWVEDNTYENYPYRCDIPCEGVVPSNYAEVIFELNDAVSGNYAPICETCENVVSVWSTENVTIIVPTIIITI